MPLPSFSTTVETYYDTIVPNLWPAAPKLGVAGPKLGHVAPQLAVPTLGPAARRSKCWKCAGHRFDVGTAVPKLGTVVPKFATAISSFATAVPNLTWNRHPAT